MFETIRNNKTIIAIVIAMLSIPYTYMELKTNMNTVRSDLGHYVRNFTFSFIIVYLGLMFYNTKTTQVIQPIKQTNIMTGRPNF